MRPRGGVSSLARVAFLLSAINAVRACLTKTGGLHLQEMKRNTGNKRYPPRADGAEQRWAQETRSRTQLQLESVLPMGPRKLRGQATVPSSDIVAVASHYIELLALP